MKKWVKQLVCCICALTTVASAVAFSGCSETQIVNAYDIAVKNGFQGTEEEWLLSLNGKNGTDGKDLSVDDLYAAAKAEGYTGSKLEFIQSLSYDYTHNNDTQTIAQNVTSVVSIFCGFTVREQGPHGIMSQTKITSAGGSGVVLYINKEGGSAYIVTNYHVVYDSDSLYGISQDIYLYPYGELVGFSTMTGTDETGYGIKATYIGGAMDYDIALLKVEGSEKIKSSSLTAATLGDSNDVKVGEKTFAIGNANGLGVSVTSGIISVDSETIAMSSLDGGNETVSTRVMRTDAAVNHGNSGGGLFNLKGELIGITNAKNVEEDTDNVCYALPITMVKYLLQNIYDTISADSVGYGYRATLGIETTLNESSIYLDENGELSIRESFSVNRYTSISGAAYNKLQPLDVLKSITINGTTTELTRRYYLMDLMWTVRKGDTIQITVLRDGGNDVKDEVTVDIVFDKDGYFEKYA